MFNRIYQLRALKHQSRTARLLPLPWSGIFRPVEPWRPMVLVAAAAAAEEGPAEAPSFHRPDHRPEAAFLRRSSIPRRIDRSSKGRLQGTQLELFLAGGEPNFYRPAFAPDPSRPLADVFPEAYV